MSRSASEEAVRRLGKLPIVTMSELRAKIAKKLPHDLCRYAACDTYKYGLGDSWLVHDNTDVVPVPGKAIFRMDATGWGAGIDVYFSGIEVSAPWWRIAVLADEAIKATGDDHHVFLEGIEPEFRHVYPSHRLPPSVRVFNLVMGS